MRRLRTRLAVALLPCAALAAGAAQAATVDTLVLTTQAPGSAPCLQLAATLAGTRRVPVGTPQVHLFYLLKDLRRGDVVGTRYARPDGAIEPGLGTRHPAHPQDSAAGCWWDTLAVGGATLGAAPGPWTATLTVNGVVVAALPFTVEGAMPPTSAGRSGAVTLPTPPAASPAASAACTALRLLSDRAAEIRIPLDQIERIDWAPAFGDGSPSGGPPEARRTAPAMQIHLTGGRVERVDLVHPPQIRFVCAASRP